ncbi:4-hydroxybenzoate octaprenyltransferase [Elstera cyanobacteriorum]|uniref:4-hydroxybenzoate octaprenyltransferase n=1 Tax=Elstera cyanobacteriorum TaxID=2022747 RepID=A0A255XMG5_9PROT|nr:4-hydroxybenzoate octaprenyltransferase [Elstera cyanobacteriorum]OYQ18159.1 4-hydroxybenzoate polyprenyltransferase [Elstera cyanobacteriorum]GFZ83326.1 4-hydroxybenzoate octaprenyltransferase [Elstera cyanobacteriorum]
MRAMSATRSDIQEQGLLALLPPGWRPYAKLARLDRPIGTWLLLFPCWWGLALAGSHDIGLYLLFALGALAMRGAGCTINDMMDRDFDRQVARTALRPLASGQVTMVQAGIFLAAQGLIGLAVLLALNRTAIALGLASTLLVAIYPLMKRITHWPQIVLGLAFNWGALMGWTAARGTLDLPALLLYGSGILWTLGYDTIYAHQDKDDDARIGVKSTALRLGAATGRWLVFFYGGTVLLIAAAVLTAGGSLGLTVLIAGLIAAHFGWQLVWLRIDDPDQCLLLFRANRFIGWLVLIPLLLGSIFLG